MRFEVESQCVILFQWWKTSGYTTSSTSDTATLDLQDTQLHLLHYDLVLH
jgi:hypothetical protein